MKTRTSKRIFSVLLSMLMCLWLIQPAVIQTEAAQTDDAVVTVSDTTDTDSTTDTQPAPDPSEPQDTNSLQLLDSTGAPADGAYTEENGTVTVTKHGTWTAVVHGTESATGLSVAAGFQGILTIRNLDASDNLLAERMFLFDGTAAGTISLASVVNADLSSGKQLVNAEGQTVPIYQITHPEEISSINVDSTEETAAFTVNAASAKTALWLATKTAGHTITINRKDAAAETQKITWNGNTFVLRTQQSNGWKTEPSIQDWTFGQTASAPAGEANYGEVHFTYAASETGPFEATVPTVAGKWYLKAEVAETEDYTGLSMTVPFTIHPADSTLAITTQSLDKVYDGAPAAVPEVQKTGSTKDVQFRWQQTDGTAWFDITDAPVHAGQYKVIAFLESDGNYKEASAELTFTISTAENSWTDEPAIADTIYGNAPAPTASPAFGTVQFTYSSAKDGEYGELPADAKTGVWYVKAEVAASADYRGLSAILDFQIIKAPAPTITVPENLTAEQDSLLSTISLPDGWSWTDSSQKVAAGNSGYAARFPVDDENYDYAGVNGYNADGHYVERLIPVAVTPGRNTWVEELTIKDWTYGQTPAKPSAKAAHGEVLFTYSGNINGTFTEEVPTQAGIWYVKATVPASDAYTELTQTAEFVIHKAVPAPELPKLQASYSQKLKDVTLPEGFAWTDPEESMGTPGTRTFTASYTPKDTANYESLTGLKLTVEVQKATNTWTETPAIKNWTYGAKANTPSGKTSFGTPYFVYSKKADGDYTSTVPTAAGTWYLKAITDGTDNYKGIVSDPVAFTIEPKAYDEDGDFTIPKIDSSVDITKLEIKDGDTVLKQGTDYEIKKTLKDKTMSVTITFKGNYKGTVVKTYTATDEEIEAYKAAQQKKSVQTSDENMTEFWAALTILSLAAVLLLLCMMRVKKKNREMTGF